MITTWLTVTNHKVSYCKSNMNMIFLHCIIVSNFIDECKNNENR